MHPHSTPLVLIGGPGLGGHISILTIEFREGPPPPHPGQMVSTTHAFLPRTPKCYINLSNTSRPRGLRK